MTLQPNPRPAVLATSTALQLPLESTLTKLPISVDSKILTGLLNPLESTLTKKRGGGGGLIVNYTLDPSCPARCWGYFDRVWNASDLVALLEAEERGQTAA